MSSAAGSKLRGSGGGQEGCIIHQCTEIGLKREATCITGPFKHMYDSFCQAPTKCPIAPLALDVDGGRGRVAKGAVCKSATAI